MVGGGGEAHVTRRDAPPSGDHRVALGKILTGAADVAAGDDRLGDDDGVAGPLRVLLQQDRVRARVERPSR